MASSPLYRWYIVALTLVNQAIAVGILIYSFALFVVPWLAEFEVSRGHVMMAIFIFQVVAGVISPVFGRLMDQYSMRLLVMTGALCIAGGLALLSQATQFWHVIAVHATLLPFGMILCGTLASQTMVSKWFTTNRGFAIGVSAMGTSIGGFIFPMVTAELIAGFDWQMSLLILAGMSFLVLLPLNFIVLRVPPPSAEATEFSGNALDSRAWTSQEILSSKSFWIPVVGLIPINAAFGGVQFNLGAYVSDLGFEQAVAAQLIAITSVSMIVGKFIFGGLGDRTDHRKLYWLMAFCLGSSLLLYEGSPDRVDLTLAAVLQGFATGGVMPMMGIMYSARFGTFSFGRVLGYVNLFLMIGSFGSIFSGWVFDLTRSYDLAFWLFAGSLIPCAVWIYYLPQPDRTESVAVLAREASA